MVSGKYQHQRVIAIAAFAQAQCCQRDGRRGVTTARLKNNAAVFKSGLSHLLCRQKAMFLIADQQWLSSVYSVKSGHSALQHRKRAVGQLEKLFGVKLRSEEHTSELQSRPHLVCRLLLE